MLISDDYDISFVCTLAILWHSGFSTIIIYGRSYLIYVWRTSNSQSPGYGNVSSVSARDLILVYIYF